MDPDIIILFLSYLIIGVLLLAGLIWLAKKIWAANWHISLKLLLLVGLLVLVPVILPYIIGPVTKFVDKLNLMGGCC